MILFADMDDVEDFDEETCSDSPFKGAWEDIVASGLLLLVEDDGCHPNLAA
jgi:hypothetical protein